MDEFLNKIGRKLVKKGGKPRIVIGEVMVPFREPKNIKEVTQNYILAAHQAFQKDGSNRKLNRILNRLLRGYLGDTVISRTHMVNKNPYKEVLKYRTIDGIRMLGGGNSEIDNFKRLFRDPGVARIINKPNDKNMSFMDNVKQKAHKIWQYSKESGLLKKIGISLGTIILALTVGALAWKYRTSRRPLMSMIPEKWRPFAENIIGDKAPLTQAARSAPYAPPLGKSVINMPITPMGPTPGKRVIDIPMTSIDVPSGVPQKYIPTHAGPPQENIPKLTLEQVPLERTKPPLTYKELMETIFNISRTQQSPIPHVPPPIPPTTLEEHTPQQIPQPTIHTPVLPIEEHTPQQTTHTQKETEQEEQIAPAGLASAIKDIENDARRKFSQVRRSRVFNLNKHGINFKDNESKIMNMPPIDNPSLANEEYNRIVKWGNENNIPSATPDNWTELKKAYARHMYEKSHQKGEESAPSEVETPKMEASHRTKIKSKREKEAEEEAEDEAEEEAEEEAGREADKEAEIAAKEARKRKATKIRAKREKEEELKKALRVQQLQKTGFAHERHSGKGVDWDGKPDHLITDKEIRKQHISWFMRDELGDFPGDRENSVNILNLDTSRGKGTHWTIFIVSKPSGKLFYVDPFSEKLSRTPLCVSRLSRKLGLQLVTNKYQIQPNGSNFCGYIGIYLAKKFRSFLKKNGHMTTEDFKNIIQKSFTKTPSDDKMRKLMAWSEKNNITN